MFKRLLKPVPCNLSLLIQSTPGLLISLAGLMSTGVSLKDTAYDDRLKDIPILLEANCILTFKGNIELIFAACLSSMSQSPYFSSGRYFRYAFDNSNLVFAQSTMIGFTVGAIGAMKNIVSKKFSVRTNLAILTGSLISCVMTSIAFTILLIVAIELSKRLNMNPDNIILPTVSSLGDYINVKSLIYLTVQLKNVSVPSCMMYIIMVTTFFPICIYFILMSKKRIPLQSLETLFLTYIVSASSGYILETFSSKFPALASSYPVFSGVSVAISLVHLNRMFTSITNQAIHDVEESHITLVFASIPVLIVYFITSALIGLRYPFFFSILFVILFTFQVVILLKIAEKLITYLDQDEGGIGITMLPLITSASDILTVIFLLIITFTSEIFSGER